MALPPFTIDNAVKWIEKEKKKKQSGIKLPSLDDLQLDRVAAKLPTANIDPFPKKNPNPINFGAISKDLLKKGGQMLLSGGGKIGATIIAPLFNKGEMPNEVAVGDFGEKLFGSKTLRTIPGEFEEAKKVLPEEKYGKFGASTIAFAASLAPLLDLSGLGGEKVVVSSLAKLDDIVKIENILKKINVADDLVKDYAPILAKTKNEKEVSNILAHISEIQKSTSASETGAKELLQSETKVLPQELDQSVPSLVDDTIESQAKQRGFITSVKESEQVGEETKKLLGDLPEEERLYQVKTDKEALEFAQEAIKKNPEEALTKVLSADNVDKETVTTGIELMRKYRGQGNFEMEAKIAAQLAKKGTESGQAIQAFSILDNLSPDGMLVYASKQLGRQVPEELAEKLRFMTDEIGKIPSDRPYDKFLATQNMMDEIAKHTPRTKLEKAYSWAVEIANIPRSVMSSFLDFSFGLRQGIVTAGRFPKEFAGAFKGQFKPFASEKAYGELMNQIMRHPLWEQANKAKVGFTDINAKLVGREERYMSSLAEQIPLLKIPIRATNRAYTAMANKLRMDTFSTLYKNAERMGLNPAGDENLARQIAGLVNDITGRGELGKTLNMAAPLLNSIFYSPRLMASRLNLLVPARYVMANPMVRKEYAKTMLAYGAFVTTIIGLASLHPKVKVGTDPRSADFAKIRIGNTRIDISGGFQQYIRIAAQLITGKYVSSTTGKIITLGEGYKPLTRKEILLKGLEAKEAPIFSFLTDWLTGQDAEGNKISVPKEIGKRFIPMLASDLWEVYKEDPELLPFGILGAFGAGIQSYAPPEAYQKLEEFNKMPKEQQAAEFEKLKKANPKLAEQLKTAKIQENFTEFDWNLTYMGVDNGERARFLMEHFKKLPKEQQSVLYDDLRKKRLISDRVADQIKFLMVNPDYEIKQ